MPSLQARKPGPACYSVTLRNTDTVQQTWCRLPDKSKCCTRQPLRRKKQQELQKQAGWPREQEVALLGRLLSGAPLPCLWHQPLRVCILCTLHSRTDTGELGEAEGPKRQRGHTEGWTGCLRAWWQMLQRVWQQQHQVMTGARDGDGGTVCSRHPPPGGLDCSHTRASLLFLHCGWAGTAAVLSWSWVRRGLQVSGVLHCDFPSAERGAALSTAAILPCLLHDWVWPCLSLSHGPSIMQTVDPNPRLLGVGWGGQLEPER